MSSAGKNTPHYIAKEASPNKLPASPIWHTIRWTSSSLKKTTELDQSGEVLDSPFEQGSAAVSAQASGDIGFEFTALSQDPFLEGVSRNVFIEDASNPNKSLLTVGGVDEMATYTIVKHDKKLGFIEVFTGCRINQLTISASNGAKITGTASIVSTGYEMPSISPVVDPLPAPDTKFNAAKNVKSFKILGNETAGSACADTFEITINNQIEAVSCLGSGSLIPNRIKDANPVQVLLSSTALLTNASKVWLPYVESRAPLTAGIGIEDNAGNKYDFDFTYLELDNDGMSDLSATEERTLDLEFRHVKQAMTITRTTV